MDALERLRAAFPIDSNLVGLELPEARVEGDGALVTTLRLIVWEVIEGRRMVRDIKEQEIRWPKALVDEPRFGAFVEGWGLALAEVFAAISERGDLSRIEVTMPYDLVFMDALGLKRARSADDFCELCLRPGRLGRLLPG